MALTQLKTGAIADDAVTGAKIADDTVAEANIANDAIGLTELKAGTDGQIITYDASGNPVAVGPGTDGQVLTSTGAGSPPAFEDLPASGIASLVADTSPQLGGTLDSNGHVISVDDSSSVGTNLNRIKVGTGDDLHIWHNSGTNNTNISAYSGDLYLQGNNGSGTAQNQIAIKSNAAVELNYQGTKKFETYANGIYSHGNLNFTTDNSSIYMGADDDVNIKHSGSDFLISNGTGSFDIKCTSGTGAGEGTIVFSSGNGTGRTVLQSDGHFRPYADAAYYLGTSSYRWLNVYTSDLDLSNEAKGGNDIDGTWGHWTIQEGESDLFLKNNRSGKKYKFNLTEVT